MAEGAFGGEMRYTRGAALLAKTSPGGIRPLFWQSLGYATLPLRVFIGGTFVFAALQKLSNPNFFNPKSPISIEAQLAAYARFSPLHLLLQIAAPFAGAIGLLIAMGELAVGLGLLLGVMPRLAAVGGMIISFLLFLTVSFHSNPYYTGSDIVFLFAFTPLAIGGNGGVFSLSTWMRRRFGLQTETVVAAGFQMIQQTCGFFDSWRCGAQRGGPCSVRSCPILLDTPSDEVVLTAPQGIPVRRREFLTHVSAIGVLGASGIVGGAASAFVGRAFRGAPSPSAGATSTNTPTTAADLPKVAHSTPPTTVPAPKTALVARPLPAGAKEIGKVVDLGVGKVASFVDPDTKSPAYILHPSEEAYVAYSAICPHAGCTVQYDPNGTFVCPCHGSTFDALTGAVELGPADRPLTAIPITISSAKIYADPPRQG